jgi:murein DD-endopeptidase MepM/ murein hydrolase activator NlpD
VKTAWGVEDSRQGKTPALAGRRRGPAGGLAPLLVLALLFLCGCAARNADAGPPQADVPASAGSLSEALSRLVWPLRFDGRGNVRSLYGYRARGGGYGRYHYGLDLQAHRGDPVYSVGDGVVAAIGSRGAYGNSIRIDHGHELSTFYAHLDRVLAAPGRSVRRGQVIGRVGSTGNATGPHLHFELRWRDRWIDPLAVLPRLK